MNINQLYSSGGEFLKADDLKGQARVVTIKSWHVQEFENDGKEQQKLVLAFNENERTLVVNKTNAAMIADIYGPDTDAWVGKVIELRPERVPFAGRMVDAIRVHAPSAAQNFQAPQPTAPAATADQTLNDDIPW